MAENRQIYFSGVHGAGKTSIMNSVANRLRKLGNKVWVLTEFPYIPDIEMGTMEFQMWYSEQMELREEVASYVLGMNEFDYVLMDRHWLDVEVYTNALRASTDAFNIGLNAKNLHKQTIKTPRIGSTTYKEWMDSGKSMEDEQINREDIMHFVVERSTDDIIKSITLRYLEEEHRAMWDENRRFYIDTIKKGFREFLENESMILINDAVLKGAIKIVMEHIMERWH